MHDGFSISRKHVLAYSKNGGGEFYPHDISYLKSGLGPLFKYSIRCLTYKCKGHLLFFRIEYVDLELV